MTISLRRAEATDYEALYQICAGPKAIWGTYELPFPSLEAWRKRMAERPESIFSLVACSETKVIGLLDLITFPNHPRRRHVGQIGIIVHDDWHGQGVGTTLLQAGIELADKWFNLRRLELQVYTDNEPAIRLYKKFGFGVEGTLVQIGYREGQYVDGYTMARLKPDS